MYTEDKKNIGRNIVIYNAIKKLTSNRNDSVILNNRIVTCYYEKCYTMLHESRRYEDIDFKVLDNWLQFNNSICFTKKAENLKVLYLSGPNPENDLEEFLKNGVIIENIWALEFNDTLFEEAVESMSCFWTDKLKLYKSKIETFLKIYPNKFDIIYADFTGSFLSRETKPYKAIHSIFENHALTDISVLIINTTKMDQTEDNSYLLSSYFLNQQFVDASIYGKNDVDFVEGPDCHGIIELDSMKDVINKYFDNAYSAFQTHYLIYLPTIILPSIRNIAVPEIKKYIFNEKLVDELFAKFQNINGIFEDNDFIAGEFFLNKTSYPFLHFLHLLKKNKSPMISSFSNFYFQDKVDNITRYDAVKLSNLLRASFEGYWDVLNDKFKTKIIDTANLIFDRNNLFFCDVPLEHLWYELIYNQMGYPYQFNTKQIERYSYIAKTREMYIDMIVYDKCRNLYDYIPSLEFLPSFVSDFSSQVLMRILIDIIHKNSFWMVRELYSGASVLDIFHTYDSIENNYRNRIIL